MIIAKFAAVIIMGISTCIPGVDRYIAPSLFILASVRALNPTVVEKILAL